MNLPIATNIGFTLLLFLAVYGSYFLATFLSSWLLSKTALKGKTSSFALELPPYRRPQIGKVLIRSVLDDAAPNYVQPILEEGMADGSIQTDSPRELAQALLLLTDLWAAPILQPVPPEEVRSRCLFLNQLTRPFGFELMDEELIQQLESYWRA